MVARPSSMLRNRVVEMRSGIRNIAFLSDYLPRKYGIATFTSDLLGAVAARHPRSWCFAVAVNDVNGSYRYPNVVRFEIQERDLGSYRRAAVFLNSSKVDVVSVQHEFGIFGGPAGSHLLTLLRELKAPIVTTLHTVLLKPNADQHRVMQELIACSTRLVVMTERGRHLVREQSKYNQNHSKRLIHGASLRGGSWNRAMNSSSITPSALQSAPTPRLNRLSVGARFAS